MDEKKFDLEEYMTQGVEGIVKDAMRATLQDPKESAFMARFAISCKRASVKRASYEAKGEHIPAFLIASITSSCNLHCAGCYARENKMCFDAEASELLPAEDWEEIFKEARDLGVSFILLSGGEPLMRRDVLDKAAKIPEIMFPVFTNGTLLSDSYIKFFDKSRNMIPIFSIEGNEDKTDERRGDAMYKRLVAAMDRMHDNHLLFGASVTVTTSNLAEVTDRAFLETLRERGCKAVVYVEFVPVTEDSISLAPRDREREILRKSIEELREVYSDMLFISFPGDEKTSGGCLAAGRGFFHINPQGGAEPCPFSPYSDINVRDTSVREALKSRLFHALQNEDVLEEDHPGGCVLFERKERVEELLNSEN